MPIPIINGWDLNDVTPAQQVVVLTLIKFEKILGGKINVANTVADVGLVCNVGNRHQLSIIYHPIMCAPAEFVDVYITNNETGKTVKFWITPTDGNAIKNVIDSFIEEKDS